MRIKANVGQTYLQKHLNYTILLKYFVLAISTNSNHFLMCIEMSLSQRGIITVYDNIPIQLQLAHQIRSL